MLYLLTRSVRLTCHVLIRCSLITCSSPEMPVVLEVLEVLEVDQLNRLQLWKSTLAIEFIVASI
jgi:hypothetical protein